jgi:hypothetical protein
VGSIVLVHYENDERKPHNKLDPILRGPYKVISVDTREQQQRGAIYTCRHLATNKVEDFHVTLLQPFNYDPEVVDPIQIAMVDQQLYEVGQVLDHVFEGSGPQTKTNLKFHIQWKGYDVPTWEIYAAVSKVELVHNYLKKNKLAKFIPSAYKEPRDPPPAKPQVQIQPEPLPERQSKRARQTNITLRDLD